MFVRAAYLPLLPRVVGPDALAAANARLVGTESAMQVADPGSVVPSWPWSRRGTRSSSTRSPSSCRPSACTGWTARRLGPRARAARTSLRREIATGVRVVARDRYLRYFTVQGGASNFALTGYGALLVLFPVRDLGLDPAGSAPC